MIQVDLDVWLTLKTVAVSCRLELNDGRLSAWRKSELVCDAAQYRLFWVLPSVNRQRKLKRKHYANAEAVKVEHCFPADKPALTGARTCLDHLSPLDSL